MFTRIAFAAAFASVAPHSTVFAQERDRAKIPDKYKWNLADIYPSEEAWREAKDRLVAEIPKLGSFRGTLGSSAARLADALDMLSRLNKEAARAYVYASMLSDQDTRVSKYQGMQQEMIQVGAQLGAEAAFIEPEILKVDKRHHRQVRGRGAAAEALPALPGRHPAAPCPHEERRRGEAAGERSGRDQRSVDHLRRLLGRGLRVSVGDAQRRQDRQAR